MALVGNDYKEFCINGRIYRVSPPTIEVIALVGDALCDNREGEDIEDVVFNTLHCKSFARAMSRMIARDDTLADGLAQARIEEIVDAIEECLSMLSIDEWERSIGFDQEKNDSKSETAGNATLMGQIATFMENLHLSYDDVYSRIPYRNLMVMQKDKLHTVMGSKVHKISGKEMMAHRTKGMDLAQ